MLNMTVDATSGIIAKNVEKTGFLHKQILSLFLLVANGVVISLFFNRLFTPLSQPRKVNLNLLKGCFPTLSTLFLIITTNCIKNSNLGVCL